MNEIAVKPTIQHFKLVQETEEKINAFITSFVKSKFVEAKDLLTEEKVRWLYFYSGCFKKDEIPEELFNRLNVYNYSTGRVYFIYPAVLRNNYDPASLPGLRNLNKLFMTINFYDFRYSKNRPIVNYLLKLIDKNIIVPIKKSDYRTGSYCRIHEIVYNQEDIIRRYNLDLDYYESFFKKELIEYVEYLKDSRNNFLFVVNKYGQPITVSVKYTGGSLKGEFKPPRIEVDEKKKQLVIITDCFYEFECKIVIDIKTNSIVSIKSKHIRDI